MATITLNYNARNSVASKTIEYILSLGIFKAEEKQKKVSGIDIALQEIKEGKVTTYENVDDLLRKINS
jgi:hypothetical protein